MKVKVRVDREQAILAGSEVHGTAVVDVSVAELTERQRQALASLRQYERSEAYYGMEGNTLALPGAATDQVAVATALDQLADQQEAAAAGRAADLEREVLRLCALPQEGFNRIAFYWLDPVFSSALRDPRLAGPLALREKYQREEEAREMAATIAASAQREAEQAAQAAEEEATAEARRQQREEWVAQQGTPNQQARYAAGLLSVEEIEGEMADGLFRPLAASYGLYQPMGASGICTCEYDAPCHADFSSEAADSATAREWEVMEAIRAALPGAETQLRKHTGESVRCEQTRTRMGVRVTVVVGAYRFSREYAG